MTLKSCSCGVRKKTTMEELEKREGESTSDLSNLTSLTLGKTGKDSDIEILSKTPKVLEKVDSIINMKIQKKDKGDNL